MSTETTILNNNKSFVGGMSHKEREDARTSTRLIIPPYWISNRANNLTEACVERLAELPLWIMWLNLFKGDRKHTSFSTHAYSVALSRRKGYCSPIITPDEPFTPLLLPNGTQLNNRIAKAAMEEKMASVDKYNQPPPELLRLYEAWGRGGAGLFLSWHIMIDPGATSAPGDVLLAKHVPAAAFDETRWRQLIASAQCEEPNFGFKSIIRDGG